MEPVYDRQKELLNEIAEHNSRQNKLLNELAEHNIDLSDRWSKGIDHHPKSEELVRMLADIDWLLFDDYFCWKIGGDGDNGESLMYELDIIFDLMDAREKAIGKITHVPGANGTE
jgi:hypothetical protein